MTKQLHPYYPINGTVGEYNNDDERWCPECNSELYYKELIGGGYHIWCNKCDYERWED